MGHILLVTSNPQRFDNGFDHYASVPYLNDPHGRIISIGWMSNWLYGQETPTSTWRGQYTIPRELTLKTVDGQIHLIHRPIQEFNKIIEKSKSWSMPKPNKLGSYQKLDLTAKIPFTFGPAYILEFEYNIGNVTNGNFIMKFCNSLDESISLNFDFNDKTFEFDRRKSGNVSFNPRFGSNTHFNRISNSNILSGKMILNTTSIEIFLDGGLHSFTSLFFPSEPYNKIQLFSAFDNADESLVVSKLSVSKLNSIWTESHDGHNSNGVSSAPTKYTWIVSLFILHSLLFYFTFFC